MFKLTEKRFAKVESSLERYRSKLVEKGDFDPSSLEKELKDLLSTGYKEVQDLCKDIVKRYPRFRLVAIRVLEFEGGTGVDAIVQGTLAKAYGISNFNSDERAAAKEAFWTEELKSLRDEESD
jgi:hypothetical protein